MRDPIQRYFQVGLVSGMMYAPIVLSSSNDTTSSIMRATSDINFSFFDSNSLLILPPFHKLAALKY